MKIRVTILSFALAMLGYSNAHAQGGDFDFLNVGVGVSGWGIPLYVGADLTVADQITVGAVLSAQRKVERWGAWLGNNQRWVHTIIGVGGNANYHFLQPGDEFDVYAGATVGYYFWNTRSSDSGIGLAYAGGGSGGFGVGLQVGGRYFLDNGIVLHAEAGGGTVFSSARVGVSFPF